MKLKRTMFKVPSENSFDVIKVNNEVIPSDLRDAMEKAGYTWINALDIESYEDIFDKSSGLACNHLYLKDNVFYVWLCWESENGFMDTTTGNLMIYKFGELVG